MIERRTILKGAGAALTTSLFTGRVKGANDRISVGHIGIGAMGSSNLGFALKLTDDVEPVAVCDVYQPHLEKGVAAAAKAGKTVKAIKDFREILADKSIDAVCISTPDHWHAYMTVEACKAGKDVFVEKPASVYVEEGQKMVQAARKYKRVVQAGTMQRSGGYFLKAAELVKSGILGEVTFVHTWQSGATKKEGWGKPTDGPVPEGLDWEMWLGPAPKVPFNKNRWGVGVTTFPTFRYFWDYAGGAMTDWGVHLIDPVHQCFGEPMPTSVSAQGGKFYVGSAISEDNERQKPQPIAIGKDITGEGKPNLVVMEWSGGAHCCSDYYVFELGESIREIAKITTGNPSGHFKDLDGDSRLEFITLDDTFAYWNTSYVDSPMPQVILTFYDGAYHIAAKLMWKPAPSRAQLSRLANRLRSQNQVVPGFFNSSELWGTMLNLIYTGHGDLAEQFFETAWNHKTQGKKEFYKEFQAQLRQSQYWPEIREMNSSSRK